MSAGLSLETARLILATPSVERAAAMRDFVARNADHLRPWSPPAPAAVTTLEHWEEVASSAVFALAAGTLVRLWLSPREDPQRIVGSIGYSQISRGPFCNAVLGYQIDAACEGQGLMFEALEAANRWMFEQQRLHRIAANYRPENTRSGRLLKRLGFDIEGFARNYLFIDGDWRDHILASKVNPAFDRQWLQATAP
jgi:[ribosomal protein S5]-alanine N-acetyltransferase